MTRKEEYHAIISLLFFYRARERRKRRHCHSTSNFNFGQRRDQKKHHGGSTSFDKTDFQKSGEQNRTFEVSLSLREIQREETDKHRFGFGIFEPRNIERLSGHFDRARVQKSREEMLKQKEQRMEHL